MVRYGVQPKNSPSTITGTATSRTDIHYGKVSGAPESSANTLAFNRIGDDNCNCLRIQLPSSIKLNLNEWHTVISHEIGSWLDEFKPNVDVWFAKLAKM